MIYRETTTPEGEQCWVEHLVKLKNDNRLLPCFLPRPVEKLRVLVPAGLGLDSTDGFAVCNPLKTKRWGCWWIVRKFAKHAPPPMKNTATVLLDGEETVFVNEAGTKLTLNP